MTDQYRTEFSGRSLMNGLMWFSFAILSLLAIIPSLIYRFEGWNIAVLMFGIILLISLPGAYLGLTPKKLVIHNLGIEYWFGNKKKFEALWPEVTTIRSTYSHASPRSGGSSVGLQVEARGKKLDLSDSYDFGRDELKKIFFKLIEIQQIYQDIVIDDNCHWVIKGPSPTEMRIRQKFGSGMKKV